ERPLSICSADQKTIELIETIGKTDRDLARRGAEALLQGPLAAAEQETLRKEVAQRLSFLAGGALCLRALGDAVDEPEWSEWLLKGRAKCLKENNHPLAVLAEAELAEFVGARDGFIDAKLLI